MPTFKKNLHLQPAKPSNVDATHKKLLTEGITAKTILHDQHQHAYLAKQPDPLTVEDVFKDYLPKAAIDPDSPWQKAHIKSIELESAFLEVLMPSLVKALFGEHIVVPEVFLHVESDNSVYIISKLLPDFEEFLAHKPCLKEGKACFEPKLPSRKDLALTKQEAFIIGQLYAVGLVINHWDLLNSKLRNSGKARDKPAIVDFGFCAHLSYKGRHADSLPLDDQNFNTDTKPNYNFFGQTYLQHYRHRHALPFDHQVAPMPTHTLIEDLYEMSKADEISQAMQAGFEFMVTAAQQNIKQNPKLLVDAFQQTLDKISNESHIQPPQLLAQINRNFYKAIPGSYNLFSIIKGRLFDCCRVLAGAKSGFSTMALQQQTQKRYQDAQSLQPETSLTRL